MKALDAVHGLPSPNFIPSYGPSEMAAAIDLLFSEYLQSIGKPARLEDQDSLRDILEERLTQHLSQLDGFIHRDFHAENLIWLPDRAAVGVIDFQDAVKGDPVYDVASLLHDARRDVSPDTKRSATQHYLELSGISGQDFSVRFDLCTVQRNLRIIGIFTRLCAQAGKPRYIDLIPRVWRDLRLSLENPALRDLQSKVLSLVPEPTPDILRRLKVPYAQK